jgi:basic amino acid/polyamine antiporter, APA family
MENTKITLKRGLSLPLITFYGLGNILGAGIYVLVGKVAGEAGYFAPLSFFIASIIAAISAFTYAELSARYPVSAGEAVYLYEGFGLQKLSLVVGLMIAFAGIVSSATIAHGFAGYMQVFIDLPQWSLITLMLLVLGLLAAWGISQSVRVAALLTVVEIAGLLIIIFVGADDLPQLLQVYQHGMQPDLQSSVQPGVGEGAQSIFHGFSLLGVTSGAFLAFYAYIGFEDMVNVAEEVKDPQRTLPKAILLSVIISMLLYSIVALVSIGVLTPQELAASEAPLAAVYTKATGQAPVIISVIGGFAVINGALIQIIMTSRMFYGLADRGWLPGFLQTVYPLTRTPLNSTLLTVSLMILFALSLPMVTLAEMTSYLILLVFVLVNLALIKIKKRHPKPEGVRVFSPWLPRLGFTTAVIFFVMELLSKFS